MTTSSARKMAFRLDSAMAAERAFPGFETDNRYAVERLVLRQGEVVVANYALPLHDTRNMNLKPLFLELLERHSFGTFQATENFASHSAYFTTLRRADRTAFEHCYQPTRLHGRIGSASPELTAQLCPDARPQMTDQR